MWGFRRAAVVETSVPEQVPTLPRHPTVVLDLTGVTWEKIRHGLWPVRQELREIDPLTTIVIKGISEEVKQHMAQCGIESFFTFDDAAEGDVRRLKGT